MAEELETKVENTEETHDSNNEGRQWYVVNTYSGHENKVKENLEKRVESMGLQNILFNIVIPEHVETEIKNGKKVNKTVNMFPGYVLVEMVMTDEAWFIVRNTPGVTGFIGSSGKGAKPFPLTPMEVDKILGTMGISRLEIGNDLNVGDKVKVINGPFANMHGKVDKIDLENQVLEVLLDLFGQETNVELKFTDIEKAKDY